MKYVDTEKLKDDINAAVEEAQEKIMSLKMQARQKAFNMKDEASDRVAEMKGDAQEKLKQFKDCAYDSKEKTTEYVRRNPERSMLIAAGIGALAGIIIAAMAGKKRHH